MPRTYINYPQNKIIRQLGFALINSIQNHCPSYSLEYAIPSFEMSVFFVAFLIFSL